METTLEALILTMTTKKVLLKKILTDSVAATIAAQADNSVLNAPAPAIDESEKNLPRKARTSLSQLRSGYSSRLNTCPE